MLQPPNRRMFCIRSFDPIILNPVAFYADFLSNQETTFQALKVYLLTPSLPLNIHTGKPNQIKKKTNSNFFSNRCGNKKPQLLIVIRKAFFSPYVCLLICVMELIIILNPHMKIKWFNFCKTLRTVMVQVINNCSQDYFFPIVYSFGFFFFFFGCATCRDLSSPMRDQTQAPCFGSTES